MVQFNNWEEGFRVKEVLNRSYRGTSRYDHFSAHLRGTVYRLSVADRVRWRWNSCYLHHFGEDRALQTSPISGYRIHMVVPVDPVAHAVISLWARFPSFISVPDISMDRGICGAHDFYVGLSCRGVAWRDRRGRDGPVGSQ